MDELTDDERRRTARAQEIALFRYQLIRAAADPDVGCAQRGAMVRATAAQVHTDPFGTARQYSRESLDRWIRAWRAGGFTALIPSPRQPQARTDGSVLDRAAALKRENPARTAAQVQRILAADQGLAPSQTTLLRHFRRLDLPGCPAGAGQGPFGRFEATGPNDLWTGDALHGPRIAGRKTYLFAFLDDHSRLIVGHRFGFSEDTVRLAAALRPAFASRGIPNRIYVDNGSAFVDSWLLRACAKLGVGLTHSTPGRPQGRGKIERFFLTVNVQFLVEVGADADHLAPGAEPAAVLAQLNFLFTAWVETVYHTRVHTETGQSPLTRWHDGWQSAARPLLLPDPPSLAEAFLWSETRKVTKVGTISLHNNVYQVDAALAGRRIEVVFDPFDLTELQVRFNSKEFGVATPLIIGRHSHPKAKPETPAEPIEPTGIDYLALVAADNHTRYGQRIDFDAMTTTTTTDEAAAADEQQEQQQQQQEEEEEEEDRREDERIARLAAAQAAADAALEMELAAFAALLPTLADGQIPGQLDIFGQLEPGGRPPATQPAPADPAGTNDMEDSR